MNCPHCTNLVDAAIAQQRELWADMLRITLLARSGKENSRETAQRIADELLANPPKDPNGPPAPKPAPTARALAECMTVLRPKVRGKFPQEQALEELYAAATAAAPGALATVPPAALSVQQMRQEWRAAGGSSHGPNVETVTMPESRYFEFRQSLQTLTAQVASPMTTCPHGTPHRWACESCDSKA